METLRLKSINEIGLDTRFFIPSYQRGYRWAQTQVINLLDDIHEFIQTRSGNQFYCLQPVVVRKKDDRFEVIDGQQRLTTIAIILHYFERPSYTLLYETRPDSESLLRQLKHDQSEALNVDHHHFKQAYATIETWFASKQNVEPTINDEFYITLGKHVKVIWYEVDTTVEAYDLFMRLNIGKIELTNAELIKAALLQPLPPHARTEFALEWERMEQTLQNDDFWYFLNPSHAYTNRLELLFDLIVNNTRRHPDAYYTFYRMKEYTGDFWFEVRQLFARLEEWYVDRTFYHLIGYILHSRKNNLTLQQLLDVYAQSTIQSKHDFIEFLKRKARQGLPDDLSKIADLNYNISRDKDYIHNTLLFFNILEEIQSERTTHRFPFSHYALENWSLEHIHAQKTSDLTTMKQWTAWLEDAAQLARQLGLPVDPSIRDLLNHSFDRTEFDEAAKKFKDSIHQYSATTLGTSILIDDDALHRFGNLALLDQKLNTTLGNHYYPVKFVKLRQHERNGGYVPPATRNVFWKYYTEQPGHHQYWGTDDQKDYTVFVTQRITDYFKEVH